MDVLWEEAAPQVKTSFSRVTLGSVLVPELPGAAAPAHEAAAPPPGSRGAAFTTFSSLAPPAAAAWEMFCSCLILSLKSDTHWMTVMPAGTV